MDYLVLGIAVLILSVTGYRGYRLGAIKMTLYVVILLFSTLVSGAIAKPVSYLIKENTSIYTNIEKSVTKVVKKQSVEWGDSIKITDLSFPDYMIPKDVSTDINDYISYDEMAGAVAKPIADHIFFALVYVWLNIIVYLIVRIVIGTIGVISKLPVVRDVNKLMGLTIGVIEGVLILWLLFLLLQAYGSEEWAQEMFTQIKDNEFLNWIYNHNLLTIYAKKLL